MLSCTVFSFLSSFATISLTNREPVALLNCLNDDAVKTANADILVWGHEKSFYLLCVDVLNLISTYC